MRGSTARRPLPSLRTVFALTLAASAVATPGAAGVQASRAHRSAAVHARDVAHLRYVSAKGSLLVDEGRAKGTVAGNMRVRLHVGVTFTGTFTIYTSAGTIVGRGQAIPHGAGQYESFAGSLTATGGSGRYRKAHGRAQLYGVFNRGDYSLVIQTAGTLFY